MSFTVYRSSAGSGKTYTLVREYLKVLLEDTDSYRNILAVTFTNKAAGEMKRRVLGCLEELSGTMAGQGKATKILLPALVTDTGLSEIEITLRASEALKKILHHYSDFSIGTIDSFSHRIIRAFAHDFGLPVNFRVELDADELIETAVDLLLDKAGDDEQLTALLVNFLESKLEDDKSWAIDETLRTFSKLLLDEESQQHLPRLRNLSLEDFKNIAGFLRKKCRDFENSVKEEAAAAWKSVCDAGLSHQAFANGRYGISWYFEQLAGGRTDMFRPSSKVTAAFENDSWASGKATSADKEKIESIKPLLQTAFMNLQKLLETRLRKYNLYRLLLQSIYPLAVLNSIDRILQDFKKQNNIIHISEFNRRIAAIVMGEPVPFIYERTGEKYRHILIDEFQDTSALQWQNFVPLIENSLASGYFNLVVGDGKQAIYRWRNGDVEQFTSLPFLKGSSDNPLIREREEALARNFTEKSLLRNFRSGTEIVNFNNELFEFCSRLLDEERRKVYRGLAQEADLSKAGGYVSISFTGAEEGGKEVKMLMLDKTLEIVSRCRADGYSARDIAVLCRTNDEASEIAHALIVKGIPVVSGESLLLNYSPLVRMLTGLVRYIFGPVNPVIQAEILARYTALFPGTENFYSTWLNLPKDSDRRTKLFEGLLDERTGEGGVAVLRTLPVYDLFIRLVNGFCPGFSGDPYIQFFLNAVLKFSTDHSSSSADFLEWWDDHHERLSVVMPSGFDAVQVMTIHKAKGLQFPVVVYPFAGDRLRTTKKYLWASLGNDEVPGLSAAILSAASDMEDTAFAAQYLEERQKSLLDMLNVMYVVMTRPEQRLYLLPPAPKKSAELTSLPAILRAWLMEKGLWEDGSSDYEIGTFPVVNTPEARPAEVYPMPKVSFGDWRDKIRIRSRAPEIWNLDDPDSNRRFGNLLHAILAGISEESTAGDQISAMLENGLLDRGLEDDVRKKINRIVTDPELAFIFDATAEVRPEAEILTPGGHSVRPDRVIIKGDRAVVVDYKTGRPMEKYKTQVTQYAAWLEELGYRDVKKYLLYLEPEVKLEEVL